MVLFFFVALSLSSVRGQQLNTKIEIPNTPAGKQLSEWLKIFERGNQDSFIYFIENNYTKSLLDETEAIWRAERQARVYADTKGFRIRSIEESSEYQTTILAQALLTGLWFRITIKVESEPPFKITEYTSQRIQPPVSEQHKLNEKDLPEEITKFMDKLNAEDAFSGAVLLAKNNKVIFKKAYGMANKGFSIPNNLETKLNIASCTKMFTAVAVFQLIEQGKLSLTDTIGKFLPDYSNKQVSGKVTIEHLLTHSSGLGDYHGEKYVCDKAILRKVKDWFPLFENDSLSFEPGTKWQYSNPGYIILGAIIEKVSGENYFDYIQNHIFNPTGMINTGFYEADEDVPNLATGYTNFVDYGKDFWAYHLGKKKNTSLYNGAKGNPSGGSSSTLDDLLKFTIALKEGKLVSKKTFELMSSFKIIARKYDAGQTDWGYGFELETVNGQRVIGHSGGDFGVSSGVRMYPDSGDYTLIILSNYDRGGIITNYKIQELITQG